MNASYLFVSFKPLQQSHGIGMQNTKSFNMSNALAHIIDISPDRRLYAPSFHKLSSFHSVTIQNIFVQVFIVFIEGTSSTKLVPLRLNSAIHFFVVRLNS